MLSKISQTLYTKIENILMKYDKPTYGRHITTIIYIEGSLTKNKCIYIYIYYMSINGMQISIKT